VKHYVSCRYLWQLLAVVRNYRRGGQTFVDDDDDDDAQIYKARPK